jgi:hypothetical protein
MNKTAGRWLPAALAPLAGLVLWLGPSEPAHAAEPAGQAAAEPAARPVNVAPGVQLDWQRNVLRAAGSCAADLYAVSAEVARYKAERLARLRAEARLRHALSLLQREARLRGKLSPELLARLDPAQAKVATVEYAATGSVSLRLELPLTAPPPGAAANRSGSEPPADGGAPSGANPAEGDKGP